MYLLKKKVVAGFDRRICPVRFLWVRSYCCNVQALYLTEIKFLILNKSCFICLCSPKMFLQFIELFLVISLINFVSKWQCISFVVYFQFINCLVYTDSTFDCLNVTIISYTAELITIKLVCYVMKVARLVLQLLRRRAWLMLFVWSRSLVGSRHYRRYVYLVHCFCVCCFSPAEMRPMAQM